MNWYPRLASLVAKNRHLARNTVAVGTLLSTSYYVTQDEEAMAEHKNRLFSYSSSKVAACDFDSPPPAPFRIRRLDTRKKLREGMTEKKLTSVYKVDWNRPLGEGGFGEVYLGKDHKTGNFGKSRLFLIC